MRNRVIAVVLLLLMAASVVYAEGPKGFSAAVGLDLFMFGKSDTKDALGWDNSLFFGATPKVGYRINQMFAVEAGYQYLMTKTGTIAGTDYDYTQSGIVINGDVFPFKEGGMMPLFFTAGVDLVSYSIDLPGVTVGGVTYGGGTADDNETDILFGAGYGWMLGSSFCLEPAVTYMTGDAGGIQIEVGLRYLFSK